MGDTRTENREINYVNDPVGKLYRRLLPSAIGSLLTATVASLIDVVILSYFLGPSMLAVVELCMPVYMLVNTLAMLISSGAATLYAHFLGEGDRKEALCWFSASTIHMLICGSVLMLAGLLFTGPVVRLLGANDAIMEPTMEYARVLFFFMIPLIMYVQLVFFVRIDGHLLCRYPADHRGAQADERSADAQKRDARGSFRSAYDRSGQEAPY